MFCNLFWIYALCGRCGRCGCGCRREQTCQCGGAVPPCPQAQSVPCGAYQRPQPNPLSLSVTRTSTQSSVMLGERVEITLTLTNLSPVPVTATVTDAAYGGLAYDGTGVAVDGVASAELDITQGVEVSLGVGESATVVYNAVAQAVGMQCGMATVRYAPLCENGVARMSASAVSNNLCLSVTPIDSRPFGQYCTYGGEQA